MRLVLDTNAAVSGLLWHGNPGKLIDAAQAGSVTLYASALLLAELHGVLGREKFAKHLQLRGLSATQISEGYAAIWSLRRSHTAALRPEHFGRRTDFELIR